MQPRDLPQALLVFSDEASSLCIARGMGTENCPTTATTFKNWTDTQESTLGGGSVWFDRDIVVFGTMHVVFIWGESRWCRLCTDFRP